MHGKYICPRCLREHPVGWDRQVMAVQPEPKPRRRQTRVRAPAKPRLAPRPVPQLPLAHLPLTRLQPVQLPSAHLQVAQMPRTRMPLVPPVELPRRAALAAAPGTGGLGSVLLRALAPPPPSRDPWVPSLGGSAAVPARTGGASGITASKAGRMPAPAVAPGRNPLVALLRS